LSSNYYDSEKAIERSQAEARRLTEKLKSDLQPLADRLKETGLPCNEPSESGGNLVDTSGFERSNYGTYGATVSMYTHREVTHCYDCGIMIQVLDDGRHRLYAAHRVQPHGSAKRVVWSKSYEVDCGTSQEEAYVNELVHGLLINLKSGLERFAEVI